ncbi:MAG: hypothetical protein WCN92_01985 [Eubacteriales bacterium]
MKKNSRRFISLALALCIVLSCTCISFSGQSSIVNQKSVDVAAAGEVVETAEAAPVQEVATALLEATAYTAASVNVAAKSDSVKPVADKIVAAIEKKSSVQRVIDGIIAPFKYIKIVDNKEEMTLALKKVFVESVGSLADSLIKTIIKIFPMRDFVDYKDYVSKNFLKGTGAYQTTAAANAKWNVGYKSVSIIPDDVLTSPYFTAGYFNNYQGKNPVTKVLDDQCFRAVCINDGTGKGTAVFVSLDGFAITNLNVRKLRDRLADFITANNIVSLNVTTSHSHYMIDTSGLGVSLLPFIGENIKADLLGTTDQLSSTNVKFMEGLFSKGAQAIKDAFNSMKPGTLYYTATDIGEMINDKQTPIVFDHNANTIRFVPDSKSANEIWLVNAGIHPVSYDRNSTEVSAEFPYAIVKYAKELAGADVAFYQGAQEEISKGESPAGATDFDRIQAYGKKIVERIMTTKPVTEFAIEPYLNVTHAEIFLPIENPILMAAAKLNVINSTCVNTTGRFEDALLVTELGYVELGSKLAIALVPGEMAPEIAWGGAKTAADSWNGTDWNYQSMQTLAGKTLAGTDRKLIVFGLTNDEIGYIIPDNDVGTTLADTLGGLLGPDSYGPKNSHYAEMLTINRHAASSIMDYFTAMLKDFKG